MWIHKDKSILAPDKDELFFLLLNWVQSPKRKLQENSPKFDIIVTREIKKGKEKYFSILVAKARQREKYRRGSEHICLTFKEPVEILYDMLILVQFL